ncbi:MAG: P-loop NTPase family protein [Acidiferrobacter sp.]
MSKVEKALQKARAMDDVESPIQNIQASPAPTPADQPLVISATELAAYTVQIPRMAQNFMLERPDLAEAKIIYQEMEDSRVVESFRQMRTHILQSAGTSNCVVLVTSVVPSGGASFIALNIAAAFAFDETKTALLVDCRLREPSQDRLVGAEMHYGLTDYLEATDIDVSQIIHEGGLPRFRLIPAGRKSDASTEHLDSRRMKDLLAHLKARYPDRYIILDAASPAESADAAVLAELADFVILVVPYGMATESQIWTAAKSVDEQKFLGVVFNGEPQPHQVIWN